jgi:hypothetical protein
VGNGKRIKVEKTGKWRIVLMGKRRKEGEEKINVVLEKVKCVS